MKIIEMKSWIISLLLCAVVVGGGVMVNAPVWSASGIGYGYSPRDYKNGYTYGEGVYFAPYEVNIHAEPNDASPLVESFRWGHGDRNTALMSQIREAVVPVEQAFISYYPAVDVAMMTVVSDDGTGWVEVVYDHAKKKTGWVRLQEAETSKVEDGVHQPIHFGKFQIWQDFMRLNARANGIYWLTGVSQYNRMIRTKPEDGAKTLPITVMRNMKVKHVRGNWMLVEVLDFDNQTPLGWVRWRDDDGRLTVFTNFSGKKAPVMVQMF